MRETGDHRFLRLRFRNQSQQNLGDDAQRSFRADEQIFERIAGDVLHAFVPGPEDFAVRQHHLHSHDVVAGNAVFEAAQPTGIFGDVSADGGNFHRTGVGRIKQARRVGCIRDLHRGYARLDQYRQVRAVEFENLVHLHRAQNDAVRAGQTAAAQSGAGAARDDRSFCVVGQSENARDLFGGPGKHDAAGHLLERSGAIKGVRNQIFRRNQDVFVTDHASQFRENLFGQRHGAAWASVV